MKLADEWSELSGAFRIFYGVIAAIDGWLAFTDKPFDQDCPFGLFLGRYQRFGLNVQAMCDSHLQFIYMAVVAPGRTNDAQAFRKLKLLNKWLDELKREFFVVGDNAHPLKDSLQIPFSGSEKQSDNFKCAFCFWLSQLHIRIEMAFGLLTTKWRIFRTNLSFATNRNS